MLPIVRYESLLRMSSKKLALINNFNQVGMLEPTQDILDMYKHIPEITEEDNRGETICRPLFSHSSLPDALDLKQVEEKNFDFIFCILLFSSRSSQSTTMGKKLRCYTNIGY